MSRLFKFIDSRFNVLSILIFHTVHNLLCKPAPPACINGWDKQIFFLLISYRVERFDSCETLPNSASGIADACKQSQPPII
ncbi:hypothetical protein T12_5221 [Trichinella patagoniensis]|uniref:Uncharacterized protein n=1 Tax=Trichinella patagoniensis TaxID=990121 RepID=A0A0V1AAZ7_9BILA|nr:hypothetical protein T12_5221 [Trichinella patagoniensis]